MSRMDRFGGMPFAVIAVALLLASTAMVAMVHQYGDTEDGADDLEDGIDAVDMARARIARLVPAGRQVDRDHVRHQRDVGMRFRRALQRRQ